VGTLLGIIATTWAGINTSRIDNVKFQYQTDASFASAIETDAQNLATHDADGDHAAVAFVSLYAQAETVLQKLELIELAQTGKQYTAILALSAIGAGDSSVQAPKTADVLPAGAIKLAIRTSGSANISASETPPPVLSTAAQGTQSQTQQIPANDPPATQSSNIEVRSNAALIAALPAGVVTGWAFIGDASGPDRNNMYAVLDPGTDTISSAKVPDPKSIPVVSACQDMNIRIQPFQNGELGQIIGIATRGSTLHVDDDPPLSADGVSSVDKGKAIAAKWIHVTLLQGAAASASPSPHC